jgi:isopenicillin N synthase-like dioxygenase
MTQNVTSLNIPTIDFSPLLGSETNSMTTEVARKVYSACTSVGFFFAQNTGISEKDVEAMFQLSKRFFSLPKEVKSQVSWDKSNRGWVAFQREALDPITNPAGDPKEALNFGPTHNRFVPEIEGMEEIVTTFFERARRASLVVLEGYALALSLDRKYFYKNHLGQDTATTLRCLYYPSRPYQSHANLRAGIHTDYGSITLLWQDGVSGLEVEHPSTHQWISVEPIKGATCVVNTADLMMRWSNDLFISTKHRVVEPPPKSDQPHLSQERYSIAFFLHPDNDCIVETFPSCRHIRKDVYPPVRADEYFRMKLNATY